MQHLVVLFVSIIGADFDNKYKDIAFAMPLYYQIMYGSKNSY